MPGWRVEAGRIDLKAIDADATVAGNRTFRVGGTGKGPVQGVDAGPLSICGATRTPMPRSNAG